MTKYDRLPEHMREGARLYVEKGYKGGSFFTAVVSNDFEGAFRNADDTNTAAMRDWAMWLYNDAPCGCHGSPANMAAWINAGGMEGIEAARRAEAL